MIHEKVLFLKILPPGGIFWEVLLQYMILSWNHFSQW